MIESLFIDLNQDIDNYIGKATEHGYSAFLTLCQKGLALATNAVLAGAVKVRSTLKISHILMHHNNGHISTPTPPQWPQIIIHTCTTVVT